MKILSIIKRLYAFVVIILLSGCSNVFYIGETNQDVQFYLKADRPYPQYTISKNSKVLFKGKGNYKRKSYYNGTYGYIYETQNKVINIRKVPKDSINFSDFSNDSIKSKDANPISRSSRQYSSPSKSSGGSVSVKGYYRKDGTYVRPHTRKAPKRR